MQRLIGFSQKDIATAFFCQLALFLVCKERNLPLIKNQKPKISYVNRSKQIRKNLSHIVSINAKTLTTHQITQIATELNLRINF